MNELNTNADQILAQDDESEFIQASKKDLKLESIKNERIKDNNCNSHRLDLNSNL